MRKFQVNVNGKAYEVEVEELGAGASMSPVAMAAPVAAAPAVAAPVVAAPASVGAGEKVVAPMPGKIVAVKVSVGQEVKEGDLVAVLEAMKMENEIFASASGKITSIVKQVGDAVEGNDVIVTIA
ncbi:MAG: acetyl-CoA carboxylase biotin carboxyl carrier protein subunit [Epulopiscium sp. Nuni2H_MBin003]|nr:MAG: acetyl-CoA carboxylase biotin carboxyl carrier protein subunit [Epulopiscium sp. Nuni2H_MBin003]